MLGDFTQRFCFCQLTALTYPSVCGSTVQAVPSKKVHPAAGIWACGPNPFTEMILK
uniref:Uncharacterized protein n=1 Tax=Anguilla anguilla TaxID=7936 RepID=A0A0E9PFU0_ANGAN